MTVKPYKSRQGEKLHQSRGFCTMSSGVCPALTFLPLVPEGSRTVLKVQSDL